MTSPAIQFWASALNEWNDIAADVKAYAEARLRDTKLGRAAEAKTLEEIDMAFDDQRLPASEKLDDARSEEWWRERRVRV